MELKERGFTDYLAMIVSFGGAPITPKPIKASARHGRRSIRPASAPRTSPPCAGCSRRSRLRSAFVIKDQITRNALNTFHGPLVGGRSCPGSSSGAPASGWPPPCGTAICATRPGLPTRFPSKPSLICSTCYFDCAAGAVMEEGGQVLDIIGDAILAFFPASGPPASGPGGAQACASALRAAVHRAIAARRTESATVTRAPRRFRSASAFISAMLCSAMRARPSA